MNKKQNLNKKKNMLNGCCVHNETKQDIKTKKFEMKMNFFLVSFMVAYISYITTIKEL